MTRTRLKIEPGKMVDKHIGRINVAQLDATTETQITLQTTQDEALAMQDAAKALLKILDKAPEAALAALH